MSQLPTLLDMMHEMQEIGTEKAILTDRERVREACAELADGCHFEWRDHDGYRHTMSGADIAAAIRALDLTGGKP